MRIGELGVNIDMSGIVGLGKRAECDDSPIVAGWRRDDAPPATPGLADVTTRAIVPDFRVAHNDLARVFGGLLETIAGRLGKRFLRWKRREHLVAEMKQTRVAALRVCFMIDGLW
jgi:hypothetical protein